MNWRLINKVDSHIHLTPKCVIDANSQVEGIENGLIENYQKLMDKYHIETSVIMPYNDPYMLSMDFNVISVHNNLIEMIQNKQNKFYCFADVDLRNNIEDTLNEFDRVFRYKQFIGIKLHPSNTGYPVDGDYYDKVIQYANNHNLLIEIHSYPRERIIDDVCSPCRIKRIIEKYPNLKLLIAHLGGFQYIEFIGLNAYFNISAILPDFVNRFGLAKTNQILRKFGVDRLVFASDYPESRCLKPELIYETYFDILNQFDFTEEEIKKIASDNFKKMIER